MARTKSLRTSARDMLHKSCIRHAEFTHAGKNHIEHVSYDRGITKDYQLLQYNSTPIKADVRGDHAIENSKETQNGMVLRGVMYLDGVEIPVYGSSDAWEKLNRKG